MADNSTQRKVLAIGDEAAIKNLLTLVKKLDSKRIVAGNWGVDLSTISRKAFESAILDMRCSNRRPAARGYGFGEMWPSMVGRVLVINLEVNGRKTMEMVERFIFHRHSLGGLWFELTSFLRSLIGRSPWPNQI
jgi:hypothetical protein